MKSSYLKTQALELDRWAAATFFNAQDITVSSLCWLVRSYPAVKVQERIPLHNWQFIVLRAVGDGLEHFWPGHCAAARGADQERAQAILALTA